MYILITVCDLKRNTERIRVGGGGSVGIATNDPKHK